jgi:hypothetical protein
LVKIYYIVIKKKIIAVILVELIHVNGWDPVEKRTALSDPDLSELLIEIDNLDRDDLSKFNLEREGYPRDKTYSGEIRRSAIDNVKELSTENVGDYV